MKIIRLSAVSAAALSVVFEVVEDGVLEENLPLDGVKDIRFFSNGSILLTGDEGMWFCDGKEILSHGSRIDVHASYPSTFTVYGKDNVSYIFRGKEVASLDISSAEEIFPVDDKTYAVKCANVYFIYRRGRKIDEVGLIDLRKKYLLL